MLPNDDHSIHRKFGSAQGEGFGDGGVYSYSVSPFPITAQISLGELIHVQGNQLQCGVVMFPVPAISFEKPIDEMLSMGILFLPKWRLTPPSGADHFSSRLHRWLRDGSTWRRRLPIRPAWSETGAATTLPIAS